MKQILMGARALPGYVEGILKREDDDEYLRFQAHEGQTELDIMSKWSISDFENDDHFLGVLGKFDAWAPVWPEVKWQQVGLVTYANLKRIIDEFNTTVASGLDI